MQILLATFLTFETLLQLYDLFKEYTIKTVF